MSEFEKMELASADSVAERIEQIKQLLPEVASEGGIDFDKLRLALGDEVGEGPERYAFTWPGKADAIRPGELLLDVAKPDRADEDIIFEMMLRWGLELTLPIERVDAAGYPCYSVAYGDLVCCLADDLNRQASDAIADMEPHRVLMLDRILNDTCKLNAMQTSKLMEAKTGREVELRTV